jgi:putative thioredoxin
MSRRSPNPAGAANPRLADPRFAGAVRLDPKPASAPRPASAPPPGAPGAPGAAGGPGGAPAGLPAYTGPLVFDATDETFGTDVIQRSLEVLVVVDLWATWCGPCKQLSPILERLAQGDGGQWALAKVDVDANPRVAQAFAVQSIPAVKAVFAGQLLDEFTGAQPERQVRAWLDHLLEGVSRSTQGAAAAAATANAAQDALERGDLDAAADEFRKRLAEAPADPEATVGLARVELMRRAGSLDPADLRRRLAANPSDVAAATAMADLLVVNGQTEAALASLVELVRRTSGEDRDRARSHLVELFTALGDEDPAVPAARRALAAALF